MNLFLLKFLSVFLFLSFSFGIKAQSAKKNSAAPERKNPATFTISKSDFDNLFSKKPKEILIMKSNAYLDKSSVVMNSLNGDTKFLKIKLNYFPKSFLMIQVNGEYSTQIFIFSDDKSVFYKGKLEKDSVIMTKCNEDDIVSE